jgi:apolipoprotein D and lipocalin family protein
MVMALNVGHAGAGAPQPMQAAPIGLYSGRWYQVAQITKTNHHPCPGATDQFAPAARGEFSVKITCHPSSGVAREVNAHVTIVPGSGNAKFKMSFFGGLVRQEYWLLDHAADQSWALMATPGGNYLWLLARRPALDEAARADAEKRIQALGYDVARLASNR